MSDDHYRDIVDRLEEQDAITGPELALEAADEIKRLRAALGPFAAVPAHGASGGPMVCAAIHYEDGTRGEDHGMSPHFSGRIPHGAFRRAREAMREADHE